VREHLIHIRTRCDTQSDTRRTIDLLSARLRDYVSTQMWGKMTIRPCLSTWTLCNSRSLLILEVNKHTAHTQIRSRQPITLRNSLSPSGPDLESSYVKIAFAPHGAQRTKTTPAPPLVVSFHVPDCSGRPVSAQEALHAAPTELSYAPQCPV
jgi:hypothetical protein